VALSVRAGFFHSQSELPGPICSSEGREMAKKKQEGRSRRDFIRWTGSGALALGAASGPFFLFPERAAAQQKTLKILQWSHFVPAHGNWHKDAWADAGFPNGPDTCEDLRIGAKKIRDKSGHPCGLGLSQELDTSMAMRALLWSFGGAEQDEAGNVALNSKETIEALKYMKALYQESETPEVFTWTPRPNNQAILAGRVSFVANAIAITRQSEREHLPIESKIMVSRA